MATGCHFQEWPTASLSPRTRWLFGSLRPSLEPAHKEQGISDLALLTGFKKYFTCEYFGGATRRPPSPANRPPAKRIRAIGKSREQPSAYGLLKAPRALLHDQVRQLQNIRTTRGRRQFMR